MTYLLPCQQRDLEPAAATVLYFESPHRGEGTLGKLLTNHNRRVVLDAWLVEELQYEGYVVFVISSRTF